MALVERRSCRRSLVEAVGEYFSVRFRQIEEIPLESVGARCQSSSASRSSSHSRNIVPRKTRGRSSVFPANLGITRVSSRAFLPFGSHARVLTVPTRARTTVRGRSRRRRCECARARLHTTHRWFAVIQRYPEQPLEPARASIAEGFRARFDRERASGGTAAREKSRVARDIEICAKLETWLSYFSISSGHVRGD